MSYATRTQAGIPKSPVAGSSRPQETLSRNEVRTRASAPAVVSTFEAGVTSPKGETPQAEQLTVLAGPDYRIRALRGMLGIAASGQSGNPHVLPVSPSRQRSVREMLTAAADEGLVPFAKLYYSVNGARLRGALTGEHGAAVQALVDAHHASARPGDWEGYLSYLDGLTGSREVGPNRFEFLLNEEVLPEARRMILLAKSSIHLSVFQLQPDEIGNSLADVLIDRASKGVKVRVMVDGYGTLGLCKEPAQELVDRLRAGGVDVVVNECSRLKTHLDHRKLLVVDGEQGFTGGMNIGVHYQREWTDQQTRIEGPIIADLQRAFLEQWREQGGSAPSPGEVLFPALAEVPGGEMGRVVLHSGRGDDRNIKAAYLRAIQTAETSIKIATPYFGDDDIVHALAEASKRGVKVTLFFPEENNHKIMKRIGEAYYTELIGAGVDIREVPGMSHLKVATIDGRWCAFGSSNLDARSLEYNDELNCIVMSDSLSACMEQKLFGPNSEKTRPEPLPEPRLMDPIHRKLAQFV